MLGSSWVDAQLAASQEGLSSINKYVNMEEQQNPKPSFEIINTDFQYW
jgi:hypothetical protein